MKRIVALFLIFAVMASLEACNATISTSSIEPSSSTETVVSKTEPDSKSSETSSEGENIPDDKKFPLTYKQLINNLDNETVEENYQKLSSKKATAKDMEIEGVGKVVCYQYSISDGVDLLLYADPSDENLTQIAYWTNRNKVTKESMKIYGRYLGITESGMAGDQAEDVDNKLNLSNITEKAVTVADSDKCTFVYTVDDDYLMLNIMPK